MKRLPIEQVQTEDRAGTTLYFESGVPMLSSGSKITERVLDRLTEKGFETLLVYDGRTSDVHTRPLLKEDLYQKIQSKVEELFQKVADGLEDEISTGDLERNLILDQKDEIRSTFREVFGEHFIDRSFEKIVAEAMRFVPTAHEIVEVPAPVVNRRTRMLDHSLLVMSHSIILAQYVGVSPKEVTQIGLGALLHDIGFSFYPECSPFVSSQEVAFEIPEKHHTTLGYHLLHIQKALNLLASHIAYQHHEWQDGSGTPRGLRGSDSGNDQFPGSDKSDHTIHEFAEIVSVPNAYSERIFGIGDHAIHDPEESVRALERLKGDRLNEELVEKYLELVPPFPIGTPVEAKGNELEGYRGIVTEVHRGNLASPTVRFLRNKGQELDEPVEYDLREENSNIRLTCADSLS